MECKYGKEKENRRWERWQGSASSEVLEWNLGIGVLNPQLTAANLEVVRATREGWWPPTIVEKLG